MNVQPYYLDRILINCRLDVFSTPSKDVQAALFFRFLKSRRLNVAPIPCKDVQSAQQVKFQKSRRKSAAPPPPARPSNRQDNPVPNLDKKINNVKNCVASDNVMHIMVIDHN